MKIKYLPLLIVLLTSCKKELEDKVVPQSSTSLASSEPSKDLEWMINLIDKERVTNPTQAIEYANKLIDISQLHKDRNGEAIGIYKRGYIQEEHLREYGKAYQDYYEACKIFQELNLQNSVSSCYLGMGNVFYKLGEYTEALSYYQKLLQNAEKTNNKEYQAVAYRAMALCYRELGENISHIILCFKKCLKLKEELHDEVGIAECYNGIANIYYYLSKDFEQAKEYQLKALAILKEKEINQLVDVYFNLGLIYKELMQEKIAVEFFSKALQLAEKKNYTKGIIKSHKLIGVFYISKKDYIGASMELHVAEEIATQSNDFVLLEEINQLLSVCYKETGNSKKALSYSEATLKMKSINSQNELISVIHQKEQLHEVGKFESSLKKSSSLLISWEWMVLISILTISLMAFLIWGIRSKRENELLAIIAENEERIDDLKFTLMDTAKHMFDQSIELGDLKDRYNEIVDELNRRNGNGGFMNLINPN